MENDGKSYMIGSCHRHANGYGYGTRVPTERNNPGTPSVPKYKIHPDYGGIVTGSRSRSLGYYGEVADMRQAQALASQTSGDYGKFLFQVETKVSSTARNRVMLTKSNFPESSVGPSIFGNSTRPITTGANQLASSSRTAPRESNQAKENNSQRPSTQASQAISRSNTGPLSSSQSQQKGGFVQLDPVIPSHCKFDVMASTISRAPELNWSINSNLLAHDKSIDWRLGLRHPKKPSTATTSASPSPAMN